MKSIFSKSNFLLFLSILLFLPKKTFSVSKSDHCTLTGENSKDPFPSLVKCYKYNNEACCVSVHDDFINNYISNILTDACLRKYNEFEDLMCFACHPLENYYLNETLKEIYICKDFAKRLWNATEDEELKKSTTIFDNCGFKGDADIFEEISDGRNYIIPSKNENLSSFEDFFNIIKIPFFEEYKLILVDQDENNNCYNKSFYYIKNKILMKILFLFLFFIL
jgi:hypothetical protein